MNGKQQERLTARQLGALAFTAAEVPALRVCAGLSWVWVLIGGLGAAGVLSALTARRNRAAGRGPQRGGAVAAALRAPVLLGLSLVGALEAAASFPETGGSLLAALLVLALAWTAAAKGAAAAGRCAGILLWVTGTLCAIVLTFSLPGIQVRWLRPSGAPTQALLAFSALLLPGAALGLEPVLASGEALPHWPWWAGASLAAAASLVTGGILSPALARQTDAFRTLARGVSVLGVIRRFEALVNGAMLMSGFCLCTLLLTALRVSVEQRRRTAA